MATVGPLQLLVIGFDSQDPVPVAVLDSFDRFLSSGRRLVDALCVSKDPSGVLHPQAASSRRDVGGLHGGSTLWPLLMGEGSGPSEEPLELRAAGEVGLDLDAVEQLDGLIAPGSSAVLILVEERSLAELLDAAATGGGYVITLGYLEAETMLDLGPGVAAAVHASEVAGTSGATDASDRIVRSDGARPTR
jgi:hypothetical protein